MWRAHVQAAHRERLGHDRPLLLPRCMAVPLINSRLPGHEETFPGPRGHRAQVRHTWLKASAFAILHGSAVHRGRGEERGGGGYHKLAYFDKLSCMEVNKTGTSSSFEGFPNLFFYRRGIVGDWAEYLTSDMVERLNRITKEKMKDSGLDFILHL